MDRYSVIFCGTPEFACPSLQTLFVDPRFTILSVITQPDKPVGRKQHITAPPVKILAEKLGLSVLQPENINATLMNHELNTPDYLVVVAFGQILSKELLAFPKIAAVNLHASLLPVLRGASPIQHAILHGDALTGVTVQKMVEKLDAGPILSQKKVPIEPRETTASLSEKLSHEGAKLLVETLSSALHESPQSESEATFCSKITKVMGIADPEVMTAEEIDRRIRALSPWPGVRITLNGKEIILMSASLEPNLTAFPLPCAKQSTLYITLLKLAGATVITGKEWLGQNHKK